MPDVSIDKVTRLMEEDPYFRVVAATREEEAIGVAAGAYAVGRNAAVFMQSSGLGNCINALASLCIPCRIPIPMFINLRGEVGEFNIGQVPMGRATRPILDVLGLIYYTLDSDYKLDQKDKGRAQALLRLAPALGAVLDTPASWRKTCIGSPPPRGC